MKKLFLLMAVCLLNLPVMAVPFVLQNKSMKAIPLIIPGVMNPNLSPLSQSNVDLAVGQQIFFMKDGKKVLLLEVTEDLQGQKVNVAKLLRAKTKK
jgi:hypothetical protein